MVANTRAEVPPSVWDELPTPAKAFSTSSIHRMQGAATSADWMARRQFSSELPTGLENSRPASSLNRKGSLPFREPGFEDTHATDLVQGLFDLATLDSSRPAHDLLLAPENICDNLFSRLAASASNGPVEGALEILQGQPQSGFNNAFGVPGLQLDGSSAKLLANQYGLQFGRQQLPARKRKVKKHGFVLDVGRQVHHRRKDQYRIAGLPEALDDVFEQAFHQAVSQHGMEVEQDENAFVGIPLSQIVKKGYGIAQLLLEATMTRFLHYSIDTAEKNTVGASRYAVHPQLAPALNTDALYLFEKTLFFGSNHVDQGVIGQDAELDFALWTHRLRSPFAFSFILSSHISSI
jgi:hypothetical protein